MPVCKYDPNCYQKNEEHLKKYTHPKRDAAKKAAAGAVTTAKAAAPIARTTTASSVTTAKAPLSGGDQHQKKKKELVQTKLSFGGPKDDDGDGGPSPKAYVLDDDDDHQEPKATTATAAEGGPITTAAAPPMYTSKAAVSTERGKRAREASSSPTTRGRSTSTAAQGASSGEHSFNLKVPPARSSPLSLGDTSTGGAGAAITTTTLRDVYEMEFNMTAMNEILDVAKELVATIGGGDPCRAFPGVRLVGPFQVMCGYKYKSDEEKWTHWRRRYDPPEVQTVLVQTSECNPAAAASHTSGAVKGPIHFGLHRDDPSKEPGMVVMGSAYGCKFRIISGHLVHAIMMCIPPGHKHSDLILKKLRKISPESPNASLAALTKKRNKECVAKTISGLGVNVPYDKKNDIGYRDPMYSTTHFMGLISASNNAAKGMTPKQHEELYEQYRFADIANDECDFGLSLELGLNMLTGVKAKNAVAMNTHRILDTAYQLLGRDVFGHILQCHLPVLVGSKGSTEIEEASCESGESSNLATAPVAANGTLH